MGAIPTAIIIKIRMSKQIAKVDVTANMPKIENIARRHLTNGYYSGILKNQLPRKNGTTLIEFYPDDVEQGEDIPRPELQSVIVKNEFIKRFSKGELSARREVIKLIGRSPVDYPERMRGTNEGNWMTKEGQLGFLQATFGKAVPAGDEALSEAMRDWSRTGVSRNILAEIKEANAQFRKIIPGVNKETEEKKNE